MSVVMLPGAKYPIKKVIADMYYFVKNKNKILIHNDPDLGDVIVSPIGMEMDDVRVIIEQDTGVEWAPKGARVLLPYDSIVEGSYEVVE